MTTAAANPALRAERREQARVESRCMSTLLAKLKLIRSDGELAGTGGQRKYDTHGLMATP
jgi:hypothetical protein